MKETVKQRIIKFIDAKNISTRSFENACSLSNGYIRQLRNSPTADKIESIIDAFPELNRDWLLTGSGEMITPQTVHATDSTVVGANIHGSDNKIVHNDISEMIKLQQGYQEIIRKKDEQMDRLIDIIAKQTK